MFYPNYVKYCEIIGKTPYQVAAEIGIRSTNTIAGWKTGANPRPAVISKLLEYFHENGLELTVSDLFAEEETEDDIMALREQLRTRPEVKILFDVSKDAPASALLEAAALITRYRELSNADAD